LCPTTCGTIQSIVVPPPRMAQDEEADYEDEHDIETLEVEKGQVIKMPNKRGRRRRERYKY
jgi:hypothetical protein